MPFAPSVSYGQLSDEGRAIVTQMLERQGYRELAAAYAWTAGVRLAPTLDDKLLMTAHLGEELRHFGLAAELYDAIGSGELLSAVEHRARALPVPDTWLEVAVAQFLFDRAGSFQLREFRTSRFRPHAEMITAILADEEGHSAAGEAILRDLCEHSEQDRTQAQPHFNRWLRISLMAFGRPGTDRSQLAIDLGFKSRDAAETMREYLDALTATMRACGLCFPKLEDLGLELIQLSRH